MPKLAEIGTVSALASSYPRGPQATLTSSNVGFKFLSEDDVFWSENILYSNQVLTPSDGLSGIVANSSGTTSAYAFFIHSLLQARGFIDRWDETVTGSLTSYLQLFRNTAVSAVGNHDIQNDVLLGLGNCSLLTLKKYKFGEFLKPQSFTAVATVNGVGSVTFVDSASANEEWGYLTDQATGLSAGIVFYDLGLALIHGNDFLRAGAATGLSSVSFQSTYKTWRMNVFCSVGPDEFRYPSNDSAFYIASITADPFDNPTLSSYSLGYQWGVKNTSSSASKSNVYLWGVQRKETYVTSVGLYDDYNNLLAVAKLAQPLRRPYGIPLTFKIELDFT